MAERRRTRHPLALRRSLRTSRTSNPAAAIDDVVGSAPPHTIPTPQAVSAAPTSTSRPAGPRTAPRRHPDRLAPHRRRGIVRAELLPANPFHQKARDPTAQLAPSVHSTNHRAPTVSPVLSPETRSPGLARGAVSAPLNDPAVAQTRARGLARPAASPCATTWTAKGRGASGPPCRTAGRPREDAGRSPLRRVLAQGAAVDVSDRPAHARSLADGGLQDLLIAVLQATTHAHPARDLAR